MARKKGEPKVAKVMGEFKRGTLRSGSKTGPKVTNPRQAKAIAMSEAGMSRRKPTKPKRAAGFPKMPGMGDAAKLKKMKMPA